MSICSHSSSILHVSSRLPSKRCHLLFRWEIRCLPEDSFFELCLQIVTLLGNWHWDSYSINGWIIPLNQSMAECTVRRCDWIRGAGSLEAFPWQLYLAADASSSLHPAVQLCTECPVVELCLPLPRPSSSGAKWLWADISKTVNQNESLLP